jgi:hypothetical protein
MAELDEDNFEQRAIDVYIDGSWAYASQLEEVGTTALCPVPYLEPLVDAMNRDREFCGIEVTAAEFEMFWDARLGAEIRFEEPLY